MQQSSSAAPGEPNPAGLGTPGTGAELANTGAPAAQAQPSRRGTLTRQRVLTAAIAVVETGGVRDFTMRRVADRFGVKPMALYRYFRSRDDLLDGIVVCVVEELYGDPDVGRSADDWQDYLARLACSVRRATLARPLLFPLIVTRTSVVPWAWPPLKSLRWVETILETFHRCGFSDLACVAAYRRFSSFLLGQLLLEVIHPAELESPERCGPLDLADYPCLHGLQIELSADRSAEEFEASLGHLITDLDLLEQR